jgi:hypothetical protein
VKKFAILLVVASLVAAMFAGVAEAKGRPAGKSKPAQKKDPVVTYVFKGDVTSVSESSVVVDVEKGNKFARSYAGEQVEFAVVESTKVVKDDVEVSLSEVAIGDEALVQLRAPKSGAADFTARKVVVETPEVEEEPESGL